MNYLAFLIVSHGSTCPVTIKQAMYSPELSKQNLRKFIILVGLACLEAFFVYGKFEVGNLSSSDHFLNLCSFSNAHLLPSR